MFRVNDKFEQVNAGWVAAPRTEIDLREYLLKLSILCTFPFLDGFVVWSPL